MTGLARMGGFIALLATPLLAWAAPTQIFHGGPIITLDPKDRIAEAIAVEDGRIVAVGNEAVVRSLADDDTSLVDLEGHALLPGFVDSHSHANFLGLQAMSANLLPAPDGDGNSVADLQRLLREYLATEPALKESIKYLTDVVVPALPALAFELLPELGSKLASRTTARFLREAYL